MVAQKDLQYKLEDIKRILFNKESEQINQLFQEIRQIKELSITPHELPEHVIPVIQNVITGWLNEMDKLEIKLTDKNIMLKTLSTVIVELLQNKAIESQIELAEAVYPIMGIAIRKEVNESPDSIIDALYPVIGKTVSKYVSEAMKKLVADVDAKLNQSLSVENWLHRLKARKLGIPYSSYILRQSLPFFVQDIFLIDKKTGILISHVSSQSKEKIDKDLIAGMLTAIKDFITSAFVSESSQKDTLNEIKYGDLKIIIYETSHSYFALVIYGEKHNQFEDDFMDTLTEIQRAFASKLSNFNGDIHELKGIERLLSRLMIKTNTPQIELKDKKSVSKLKILLGIVILFFVTWIGFFTHNKINDNNILNQAEMHIKQFPLLKNLRNNITVSSGNVEISGLMPNQLTLDAVKNQIKLIHGVQQIHFNGSILENIIQKDKSININYKTLIESEVILFNSGITNLNPINKMKLREIILFTKLSETKKLNVVVYNDIQHNNNQNTLFSKRRSESIIKYLVSQGLSEKYISSNIVTYENSATDKNYQSRAARIFVEK